MRYGLVGTGHWAGEVHAAALAARTDGEFVGVWGRTPERRARLADRYGVRAFADPDALFDAVDVVSFAVPPDVQAPLAVQAARAGCHLLLEKPVALDLAAADALVAATRDVATVVFLTWRFDADTAARIAELRAGGPWVGGRALWLGAIAEPGSPYAASPWRHRHGALWDLGPHALAVLVPILGEVTDVAASRGPGDTVHLALRHGPEVSSTVTLSLTVPPAAARTEAAVYGDDGWATLATAPVEAVGALGRALDELGDHVRSGAPHPCGVAFGRDLVAVLERAEAALG